MNLTALDWELREGVLARQEEALALAAREHLVRELRAARRARETTGTRRWWRRREWTAPTDDRRRRVPR